MVCAVVCQFVSMLFPFGFEGGMWNLIVLTPDHCLFFISAILSVQKSKRNTVMYRYVTVSLKLNHILSGSMYTK